MSSPKLSLDFFEYAVFSVTLALSAVIGIYYGCIKTTGQNTVTGYLFGGKRMPVIPVALSLVSSYISGVTLLGLPSEVYYFSTQYMVTVICMTIAVTVQVFVSVPVFYKLQLVSTFEYMELRFGRRVRTLTSLLYCFSTIGHASVVIYGPALALNQVTGIDVQTISIGVCVLCIFYTTLGGLKAVVWTDTLQSFIMISSAIVVLIIGVNQSGGNSTVFQTAIEGNRLQFFNMDPTSRISFWSQIFGMTSLNLANSAFNPAVIQRLICLPTMRAAVVSSWLMLPGIIFFILTSGYLGLVMYAYYRDCDPYSAKLISLPDQIVPYFIMDISIYLRGLCGLFLAGTVSAAMSSLSTAINNLAGTMYDDFIEPCFKEKPSEEKASLTIKCLSIASGGVCVCLVSVVERLGSMLEIAAGFTGVASGATVGLFLLGFFHPRANSKGAAIGGVTSLVSTAFILTGYAVNKINGNITNKHSVMSVEGCPFNVTLPTNNKPHTGETDVFPLFKLPVFFYTTVGILIVITVGSIATYFIDEAAIVNQDCLSPWVRKFARKSEGKTYNAVPVQDNNDVPLSQLNAPEN